MLITVQPNPSWQLSLAQLSPSLYQSSPITDAPRNVKGQQNFIGQIFSKQQYPLFWALGQHF